LDKLRIVLTFPANIIVPGEPNVHIRPGARATCN
jgi:hypothetical protein